MKDTKNTFSVFIGLDWADQKHDVSICGVGEKPAHQVITHTPEALHEWLIKLRKLYPDGKIALCLPFLLFIQTFSYLKANVPL